MTDLPTIVSLVTSVPMFLAGMLGFDQLGKFYSGMLALFLAGEWILLNRFGASLGQTEIQLIFCCHCLLYPPLTFLAWAATRYFIARFS